MTSVIRKKRRPSKPVVHFKDIKFDLRNGYPVATVYGVEDHPHISAFEARHCINTSLLVRIDYDYEAGEVNSVETLNTVYKRKG